MTLRLGLVALLLLQAGQGLAATKIALEGEASPGGNGAYTSFSRGQLTETGKVLFLAETDATPPAGAPNPGCIFRYDVDGGGGSALLCIGDAVSLPGGDYWLDIYGFVANGAGDLVFSGEYRDTLAVTQYGTFHRSAAGVLTHLSPLTGAIAINDANDVLVGGQDLHITSPGGPVTAILLEDQELPDETGNYAADTWASLGPDGQVAVAVRATPVLEGPPFTDWIIYLWESGGFTRLGANAFGPFVPSGADSLFPFYTPGGRLLATVQRDGFYTDGIVEWDGAAWVPVVLPRPGETLFTIGGLATGGLNRLAGQSLLPGGLRSWSTVLGTGPLARSFLIQPGDSVPGGTVHSGDVAKLSSSHWAMRVRLDSASGPYGVYVGRTTEVPLLGAPAAFALAGGLLLLGAAWLRSTAPAHA